MEYWQNLQFSLGNAYMVFGKFDDKYLKSSLQQFLELLKKLPKPSEKQLNQSSRRNMQHLLNKSGLKYEDRDQNVRIYCSILNNVGLIYRDLEMFKNSKKYFQAYLGIVNHKIDYWDEEIQARKQLANSYMILKEFSNAEDSLVTALSLLKKIESSVRYKSDARLPELKQSIYEMNQDCNTEKQEYEEYRKLFKKFKNLEIPHEKNSPKYKSISIYSWIKLFEDMQSTGSEMDIALVFESKDKVFKDEISQFMRYISNDEIGEDPQDQLKVLNELISILRSNKKLSPYSLKVFRNTLDLYEWIFKASKNVNSNVKLTDTELYELKEDHIYLHIDYSSTLDDLEIAISKIEDIMVKAYFFAKKLRDFEIIIKILYYLEIYYKGGQLKQKSQRVSRVFDQLDDMFDDRNKMIDDFFNELDQFQGIGNENNEELDLEAVMKQKKLNSGAMEEEGLKSKFLGYFKTHFQNSS